MKKLIFFFLFTIGIPFLFSYLFSIKPVENYFEIESNQVVRVKRTEKVELVPLEEYVLGVLAGEMPVSFEMEALKAQAVAARSYVLKKMEYNKENEYDILDTPQNQVYLSKEDLKNLWQENYDERIEKLKEVILETNGEYLSYEGDVIEAFFFSTSSGMTENSGEVFQVQLPYLVSVQSSWDEDSPVFSENITFSLDEFYQKLELPFHEELRIDVQETTSTGRIKEISINDKLFTGNEVSYLLDLRSSYFSICQKNKEVYITTKGFGHGVGMSQYGAEGMAKDGYSYDEILKHYYQGVEIEKNKV